MAVLQRQAAGAGRDGLVDVDVAVSVQRQAVVGAPADSVVDRDVAIASGGRVAAGRQHCHAVAGQRSAQCRTRDVATAGGDGEVDRVDQPGAGFACSRSSADAGRVGNFDVRGAGFNEAAIATVRRARIQCAGQIQRAGRHAAQQHNIASVVFHRARFNQTGVVDDAGQQRVFGTGAHQHPAAAGVNHAAVGAQAVQHALVDLQLHQAVVLKGQRGGAAGAQGHRAQRRADAALVADAVPQQCDKAASAVRTGGVERAQVDNAARTRAAEAAAVAGQARVVQIQCGGDQTADVDLRPLAKQNTVRVDQKDLAVGVQAAEDLAAVGVINPIHGDRRGRRLHKVHRLGRRDVEALPVQRQVLAGLVDGCGVARLRDCANTRSNLRTDRPGVGVQATQKAQGGRTDDLIARAFALPARDFRHGHPGLAELAPDQSENSIHCAVTFHADRPVDIFLKAIGLF